MKIELAIEWETHEPKYGVHTHPYVNYVGMSDHPYTYNCFGKMKIIIFKFT